MSEKIYVPEKVSEDEYNEKIRAFNIIINNNTRWASHAIELATKYGNIYDEYSSFKAQISAIKNEVLVEENNTKEYVKNLNACFYSDDVASQMESMIDILDTQDGDFKEAISLLQKIETCAEEEMADALESKTKELNKASECWAIVKETKQAMNEYIAAHCV